MVYKDSDYIIVIAFMCWPKRYETHLDAGVMSTFVLPSTTTAQAPHFEIHWQYSSQERPTDYTAMITIVHWHLLPWWGKL